MTPAQRLMDMLENHPDQMSVRAVVHLREQCRAMHDDVISSLAVYAPFQVPAALADRDVCIATYNRVIQELASVD